MRSKSWSLRVHIGNYTGREFAALPVTVFGFAPFFISSPDRTSYFPRETHFHMWGCVCFLCSPNVWDIPLWIHSFQGAVTFLMLLKYLGGYIFFSDSSHSQVVIRGFWALPPPKTSPPLPQFPSISGTSIPCRCSLPVPFYLFFILRPISVLALVFYFFIKIF